MPSAYYNEYDPYCAAWLRNLVDAGLIAAGDVDGRDIAAVRADDLRGYAQCHFFAGIGIWSHALRSAGWPDDRPVWTGSCPCQPFSAAGRREGLADERHLWPVWFALIREHRPPVVLGEQVAGPAALEWFDVVSVDLEGQGYAVGAADLCAAGVGAPHIRQRLFFVADAAGVGSSARTREPGGRPCAGEPERPRNAGVMADTDPRGWRELGSTDRSGRGGHAHGGVTVSLMADTLRTGLEVRPGVGGDAGAQSATAVGGGGARGFWAGADWLPCRDGVSRPVEPGTFPLVDGYPGRVEQLHAYGNAIVAPLAVEFVAACLEFRP